MIKEITGIHGTSSGITFECGETRIKAGGEFFAEGGRIAGFTVSAASLRYENGKQLTSSEQEELVRLYEQYMSRPHSQNNWLLRFE